MEKKKILFNTDYLLLKTGLARNIKEVLLYLHSTNKYELGLYACGMAWDTPDFQKLPFKCYGALPNNQLEISQLNRDPGLMTLAAYGEYNIDRVIKEFRPDVLVVSNDSWSMEKYPSHAFWNKIHCIPHITIDSLPFLDSQVKLAKESKKIFVWADFAKEEYNRLGFNNVEVLTGAINPNKFFKLSNQERLDIRKKFNIPQNAFICGFVSRNQLRKDYPALLGGYAEFKRQNPAVKNTYLLLHTHFSESQGWDIPKFRDGLKIPKEEVLTTYICKGCKEIEVRYFDGQELDCRFCGAKKSQITCNVALGSTEEELNQVYNIMDFYCHPVTNGGLEYGPLEALCAQRPIATVAYSSCEMFTRQPFCFQIDNTWTYQHGTQFKRAVSYPSSIAKLMAKVYNMLIQDREKLGKQGREWALSKFSPEIIGKQWEDYFDSLPPVDWDYKFDYIPKNPNAPIDFGIENDLDFVLELYDKILNMKVDPINDEGVKFWISKLSQVK